MPIGMASPGPCRVFQLILRGFSTSTTRSARFGGFRIATPTVKEIGRFTPRVDESTVYQPGQVFIHRVFAYKGIVVCSFNCKLHNKGVKDSENIDKDGAKSSTATEDRAFYQVLIHRADWPFMGFPVDITSYLGDGGNRAEKYLTTISGMDCVSHSDILPMQTTEKDPVEHDLFRRIFIPSNETTDVRFGMRPELVENYMASQKSWLAPRDVYRERTENVEVTVITFYLGSSQTVTEQKHCWRYVIRIENLEPEHPVILRERNMKVFSLNNMHEMKGHGVVGTCKWLRPSVDPVKFTKGEPYEQQPELSTVRPAFQFSSMIDLQQPRGGHMWGKFKMERENGSTFEVNIPTIVLESFGDVVEKAEKAE